MKSKIFIAFNLVCFFSLCQVDAQLIDKKDGKSYRVVTIGSQKWMAENLNADHFSNGDKIKEIKNLADWQTANESGQPAWCYYNFDSLNGKTYGKFYNWFAVNDPRGLAPAGWKVPSIEDWRILEQKVNSTYPYNGSIDLILMSSSNWKEGRNGKDLFNFNAQPIGYVDSDFREMGEIAFFWSTQKAGSDYPIEDNVYLRPYLSCQTFQTGSSQDGFSGNGFTVRCLSSEEQPQIENKKVHLKNKYFEGMSYIDTIPVRRFMDDAILSDKDSTYFFDTDLDAQESVKPFYISDHEVTNLEYREFVNWVRDSIARVKIFQRINSEKKSEWVKYVQYDSGKKDNDGKYYILNWDKKLDYEDVAIMPFLHDLYFPTKERYYKKRGLDIRLLFFDYIDDKGYFRRINVYPDTNAYRREMNLGSFSYIDNFFWHEDYRNFPVVGLTFEQAKAYCVWRTMMYHFEAGRTSSDKYDPSLKFRLPNEEEWERAAIGYENLEYMKSKRFRANKNGWTRHFEPFPIINGYRTNENAYYQANFGPSYLNSGIYAKDFLDDGASYLCKVKSYDPNFNGLYCMYGNVAEWVDSNPKLGDFFVDYYNYLGKYGFEAFRGKVFRGKDTSKTVIYITDPYTDSTFLIEKNSEKHKNLIQKRLEFYKVLPEETFEDAKQKYIALNSINESVRQKIDKLNNPEPLTLIDSTSKDKKGIIDGVKVSNEIPRRNGEYVEIYDIRTGNYEFISVKEPIDNFSGYFKNSFYRFKQNSLALKRAENPFNRSYPNNNLQENCRLVKGGSWFDQPHYLVLNSSQVFHKDEASCRIGFRIAADAIGNEMDKYDKKRIKVQRMLFWNQNSISAKSKSKR